MRAILINAPDIIRLENLPDPTPQPDELVIRVEACGICGTDLHIIDGDSPLARYPLVPGHEFAGEVVAMGDNITHEERYQGLGLQVGSRVAVDPNLPCRTCEFCRTGHENLCSNYRALGVTMNGGFAEYVSVPVTQAYLLPDTVSWREAALIEPISCAVHGMHRLNLMSGDSLLIVGAGTMGLLLLQLAVRGGATHVAVVDTNTQRLDYAKRLGATTTASSIDQAAQEYPAGFHHVIDATGIPSVMEKAFTLVRRGGKFMIFGVAAPTSHMSLSPFQIYNQEITILGSMAVLFSFQPALDVISQGIINTDVMLTKAYALADFFQAIADVRGGKGIKAQMLPNT
jgi:2-desacetyl-2-hydroxyethyl bacteriochlorophyllide A dehydrogenase